ncbi:MAG: Rossmann-like and DUF2520 domain-containing protein [Dehalococcoidia bacterium]
MLKIGFIGAGTVGTALAVRLAQKGYPVVAASSRGYDSARRLTERVKNCRALRDNQGVVEAAELVFITTPDDLIAPVVAALRWQPGKRAVHSSGVASLDILEPAQRGGAEVGAIHPLQTFASIDQAIDNLPGSTFALEGEGLVLEELKGIAQALEGPWVKLGPGDKVLYHASAVIACNYLVTLEKLATDLWQKFGASPPEAIRALMPLLQGTLNNLNNVGLPHCLTGPIARGDLGTIQKHLKALETSAPEMLPIYRELGLHTIPIALGKGKIDEARAGELRGLLKPK